MLEKIDRSEVELGIEVSLLQDSGEDMDAFTVALGGNTLALKTGVFREGAIVIAVGIAPIDAEVLLAEAATRGGTTLAVILGR